MRTDGAVVLSGVVVRLGGRRVLGPLDLDVGAGERWVLLGPNGSGKTTLLGVAGGRRQPSAGTARVLGVTFGRGDVRVLHPRIGHASHTLTEMMPAHVSVLDVVLTGKRSALVTWFEPFDDVDRAHALERLREVGAESLAGQPLSACSQGERQRVLLARALFSRPELLILDEPAAGLDLPARERLIEALETASARADAPTMLLATHHLEEVPSSASHAALLREGRLLAAGPVDEVLTDERLRACFDLDVEVGRRNGRWWAVARR
ncbi:MAG TPA: ATP-binding cassette domain-containing protein [Actinomycetota bacterium]|nr:ATP-binding cassette domain-containing protein [Actinomycetota bacterium]